MGHGDSQHGGQGSAHGNHKEDRFLPPELTKRMWEKELSHSVLVPLLRRALRQRLVNRKTSVPCDPATARRRVNPQT